MASALDEARSLPRPDLTKVLIYRLGSLGDHVVALPAYHLIARAFPNAERRLLTNIPVQAKAAAATAVLAGSGLIHDYIQYPVGMRGLREVMGVRAAIRRFRPQALIYLSSLRGYKTAQRDRRFFQLCGIREIVGLSRNPQDFVRRRFAGNSELEPEATRLASSIRALGDVDLDDRSNWDLRLTPEELDRAAEARRSCHSPGLEDAPLLAVSIGTKAQANDWGEENWTALLTRLAAIYPTHQLALLGAKEEADLTGRAAVAWKDRSLNLCGALTPRESAALLRSAQLFLGHDSGPMHLAATVGAPCVAIFSARNLPRIWFPYGPQHRVVYHRTDCAGCELTTCIVEKKKCILSITVEEALSAVRSRLESEAGL